MFYLSVNSYRRGLRNGVLVNPKLFILEKVNLAPPTIGWSTWSNLVKLVLFGTGHYTYFLFLFYKGENQVRIKNPNDSSMEKVVCENYILGPGIRLPVRKVPHMR